MSYRGPFIWGNVGILTHDLLDLEYVWFNFYFINRQIFVSELGFKEGLIAYKIANHKSNTTVKRYIIRTHLMSNQFLRSKNNIFCFFQVQIPY